MSKRLATSIFAVVVVLVFSAGAYSAETEAPTEAPVPANTRDHEAEAASSAEDESASADEKKKKKGGRLRDPLDGKFDLTAGSKGGSGWFPLAIPFNEPALGVGLVAALAYIHPQKGASGGGPDHSGGPPTVTFGGGGATTNGTWAAAAGHYHVFGDDKARYLGALAAGSINLTFYGFGDQPSENEDGEDFTIDLVGTLQNVRFRIGDSGFYLGLRYISAATETSFDLDVADAPLTGESDLAGLTALLGFDNRDNIFTPSRGLEIDLEISWFNEAVGSDFNFERVGASFRYYLPIKKKFVLGFRADIDAAGDDAPFYALPFVVLRGVPIFRYLGNYAVTLEIEPRYKIGRRWSVLAFTGQGRAAREWDQMSDAERAYNFGAGFRYLIARKLGLGVGFDVAVGPEETVPYLIIGSAW
jgi:hypothetical protein